MGWLSFLPCSTFLDKFAALLECTSLRVNWMKIRISRRKAIKSALNSRFVLTTTRSYDLDNRRQNGQKDDGGNDGMNVLIDIRHGGADQITRQNHAHHPQDAAGHIVRHKAPIFHLADAGDDRREGAHDRHEACNRWSSRRIFVKRLGAENVAALEEQESSLVKSAGPVFWPIKYPN
jgi:hypothetical protein